MCPKLPTIRRKLVVVLLGIVLISHVLDVVTGGIQLEQENAKKSLIFVLIIIHIMEIANPVFRDTS